MSKDKTLWNGMAGRHQQVVAVVVHWTCSGDRDGEHPEQVLGVVDIDLDGEDVHWHVSEWAQAVEHDGVPAYSVECDLCSSEAIMSEATVLAFLVPLREQYRAGQRGNVTRVPLTALSKMPTRRRA